MRQLEDDYISRFFHSLKIYRFPSFLPSFYPSIYHSFIHIFDIYGMPGMVLGMRDLKVSKTEGLGEVHSLRGETDT